MNTRRDFARSALAGLVAVAASDSVAAGSPLDGAVGDTEIVSKLVQIEQLVVFSYRYLLPRAPGATLREFLAQEVIHVRTLGALARHVPAPPSSAAAVDKSLSALGVGKRIEQAHSESEALRTLLAIETLEENAFHEAIGKLSSLAFVRVAAQILTCDAQHATVLGGRVYGGNVQRAVPHAFVPLSAELKG